MLHTFMTVAAWLLGIGGVTGLVVAIVALIYLGPVVVTAIVQPIFARFIACTTCVVAVVFVLSTIAAYWLGHHQAANQCRDAELSAALRNKQIDVDNADKAKTDETNRANTIEAKSDVRHQEDLAAINLLKSRPPTCAFDDNDIADGVSDRWRWPSRAKPAAGAR